MTEFQTSEVMTDPGDTQQVSFNWSPKNLEIKTRTVERTLEPLVMQVKKFSNENCLKQGRFLQVTTLVSSKSPTNKKGKSKRAIVLVAAVERATENFVERGEVIAMEHPEIKAEMLVCVEEVRGPGRSWGSRPRSLPMTPAAQ